jgi:hypothetical protein
MNYKIKITAENQAIVKRIADENGMNVKEYTFNNFFEFYTISNNLFGEIVDKSDYSELTTEQFIELFDKKETEWQPKKGDRVLVWGSSVRIEERIFITKIEGAREPYVVVVESDEKDFLEGKVFSTIEFKHMKPLPIEQPKENKVELAAKEYLENVNTKVHKDLERDGWLKIGFIDGAKWQSEQPKETDFKSKFEAAIDLIETEAKDKKEYFSNLISSENYLLGIQYKLSWEVLQNLLNKIKEL